MFQALYYKVMQFSPYNYEFYTLSHPNISRTAERSVFPSLRGGMEKHSFAPWLTSETKRKNLGLILSLPPLNKTRYLPHSNLTTLLPFPTRHLIILPTFPPRQPLTNILLPWRWQHNFVLELHTRLAATSHFSKTRKTMANHSTR